MEVGSILPEIARITGVWLQGGAEVAVVQGRCAHHDKNIAEEHIARVKILSEIPRVRVLLAHDKPWYEENKEGPAFWPGKLASL